MKQISSRCERAIWDKYLEQSYALWSCYNVSPQFAIQYFLKLNSAVV